MRYIYYIVSIVFIFSIAIGYKLFAGHTPKGAPALVINNRIITDDEFNKLYSSRPLHLKGKNKFIEYLITKELLIQDARKKNIDKEESFRKSIQNFYEQSLIKILMDRIFDSIKTTVSNTEIDRYAELSNKKLHVTQFIVDSQDEAKQGRLKGGERKKIQLSGLSEDMRYEFLSLKEGDVTAPVMMGEKYIVFRLDKIEPVHGRQKFVTTTRDKIKEMLIKAKKKNAVNRWIADLKKDASIKILITRKNEGE